MRFKLKMSQYCVFREVIPAEMTYVRVVMCFSTKCPSVHRHVESFSVPWALVCSKWFVCLFVDVLPVETTLRVWDCLFNEGSKILIRCDVLLNLLCCHEKSEGFVVPSLEWH